MKRRIIDLRIEELLLRELPGKQRARIASAAISSARRLYSAHRHRAACV